MKGDGTCGSGLSNFSELGEQGKRDVVGGAQREPGDGRSSTVLASEVDGAVRASGGSRERRRRAMAGSGWTTSPFLLREQRTGTLETEGRD
jgi:hypothetical protein